MHLVSQNYGKQRVRVMKVLRHGARHEVKELTVGVRLEGDFETSYTAGDNGQVVATDTMKNTVQALAHRHLGAQTEPFALLLARHFLDSFAHVARVTVDTRERRWSRLSVGGRPHDHAFTGDGAHPVTHLVAARGATPVLESGLEDLLIMKSTASSFSGFPRDAFTTLPETEDRILATDLQARWRWATPPAPDFDANAASAAVLDAMLAAFASNFSPSVQTTLYQMAAAAFAAVPAIDRIQLALPNKHYLLLNLEAFGMENANVTFLPIDEPHGQIEAVIERK